MRVLETSYNDVCFLTIRTLCDSSDTILSQTHIIRFCVINRNNFVAVRYYKKYTILFLHGHRVQLRKLEQFSFCALSGECRRLKVKTLKRVGTF